MSNKASHIALRTAKIVLWTLMGIVLTVFASLICVVKLLPPEKLTPIVENIANDLLDADVSIDRVELDLGGLTLLSVRVDGLCIRPDDITSLPADRRAILPAWADTLVAVKHFEGGINPLALLSGRIALHNVTFDAPEINICIIDSTLNNYTIYRSEETAPSESGTMPAITVNRFRIDNPRPIRFANLLTGQDFNLSLRRVALDNAAEDSPRYTLGTGGNVATPMLGVCNLSSLSFGLDGRITWDPTRPSEISIADFDISADCLKAVVNATVDISDDIIVKDYSMSLGRIAVKRLLAFVPDSLRTAYGLTDRAFDTDIELDFAAQSTAPFNLTTDSLPHADLTVDLTPGTLRYGEADFRRIGGRLTASLRGNDLDAAVFNLVDFIAVGPATDLTFNIEATNVATDPVVSGCIKGNTDFGRMPHKLKALLGGDATGRLTADIDFTARPSMLNRENFHRIKVTGDIDADDFRYRSYDDSTRLWVREACFKFGTDRTFNGADSLLTATLIADTMDVSAAGTDIHIADLHLGMGASNRQASSDTTQVTPMGGGLSMRSLSLTTLADSTTMRARNVKGQVAMRRFKDHARVPQFDFNLGVDFIAAGAPTARIMLADANINLTAHKIPRPEGRHHGERHPSDSLHRAHAHPEWNDTVAVNDILDAETSASMRRLLLRWSIEGSVTARRAGMYTHDFPLRNRVDNFNMTFNNDSIVLNDVAYKAGTSDFLINGRITNIKHGLTSRGFEVPIRINFDIVSDTIDVNELAGGVFRGAANVAAAAPQPVTATDSLFEQEIASVEAATDTAGPLLIPTNIDLRLNMSARNVRYEELMFRDFTGELLAFGGAINLRQLKAASDMGAVNLSALYSAPTVEDMKFGFGLDVSRFNLKKFISLVPAVDSIMPMMRDVSGIVDANIAATCDIDSSMNFVMPSLTAAIHLEGDSLELIDRETYRSIGKWLLFKDKQRNIIDHLDMQFTMSDGVLRLFPVIFNIDRYKLGVQGYNDGDLNFNYHVAVLKSPLPFRFGINIKGNPDKYKIRLGRARLNEKMATDVAVVDTTRVNLLRQIENVFRRGAAYSRFGRLHVATAPAMTDADAASDTISAADSLVFIREGLIEAPAPAEPQPEAANVSAQSGSKGKSKGGKQPKQNTSATRQTEATLPESQSPNSRK